ncbi:MAG: gfo/Idh/MocA family oxidoreductase [Proteobacteria bacterium]|nr:gfo/Idh/MocA family oxidoreductase [Pseudomonadota bacterium]
MKKFRFVIIGCGRIASRHVKECNKHGLLIGACDPSIKRAEALVGAGAIPVFPSFELMRSALVSGIDIAVICSPNYLHAPHSIEALQSGLHVLCEKPMALNVRDCGEMVKVAERANRRLFIVKQNRFNPPVRQVKEWLDEGRLGRILSCQVNCFWNRNRDYYANSWKGTRRQDGGSLFTLFSHFIDLLYWMLGDVEEVQAAIGNLGHQGMIEIEDTGVVTLKFAQGCLGTLNYTTNAYGGNMEGSITLFGEKGTVKIGGQYLNELEYVQIEGLEEKGTGASAAGYHRYEGSQSQLGEVYANLVSVLEGKGAIATNGFEGLKTVEIIERIYKAAGGIRA